MKRLLYLILFSLAVCLNVNAAVDISTAETKALNKVSSSLPSEYEIYRYANAVNSVTLANGDVMKLSSKCWVFFLDDKPHANWDHDCRYIFVSQSSGTVTVKSAYIFPKDIESWTKCKSVLKKRNSTSTNGAKNSNATNATSSLFRSNDLIRTDLFTNFASKEIKGTGKKYAVIISGGIRPGANHPRYWNDCSLMYQILTRLYKYSPSNIYAYIADGTDPGLDIYGTISSPVDLDGNGTPDINGPALLNDINSCFSNLKNIITADDELFIFTTDHGAKAGYLELWNGGALYPSNLVSMLTGIKGTISIMMEQCFSGVFIKELSDKGLKVSIATAARKTEESWASEDFDYLLNEFSYHWSCAVAGYNIATNQTVNADTNKDGMVSMEEAFIYASAKDTRAEVPQYWALGGIGYGSTVDYHDIANYMTQKVGKLGQYEFLGESYGCDYSLPEQLDLTNSLSNTTKSYTSGWILNSKQVINTSTVNYNSKNKIYLKKGFKYTKGSGSRKLYASINHCSSVRSGEIYETEDAIEEVVRQPMVYFIETEIEEAETIALYPNPTDGIFNILFGNEEGEKLVSITDVSGKIIYTNRFDGSKAEIDLSGNAQGIYFVRVTMSNTSVIKQVILK